MGVFNKKVAFIPQRLHLQLWSWTGTHIACFHRRDALCRNYKDCNIALFESYLGKWEKLFFWIWKNEKVVAPQSKIAIIFKLCVSIGLDMQSVSVQFGENKWKYMTKKHVPCFTERAYMIFRKLINIILCACSGNVRNVRYCSRSPTNFVRIYRNNSYDA